MGWELGRNGPWGGAWRRKWSEVQQALVVYIKGLGIPAMATAVSLSPAGQGASGLSSTDPELSPESSRVWVPLLN